MHLNITIVSQINKCLMKNYHSILLSLLLFTGCYDEKDMEDFTNKRTLPIFESIVSRRAVPVYEFDWENADWMPTPPQQAKIPSPWIGQGSIASTFGIEIVNDRKKIDGWELLYNSFNIEESSLVNPYFILYNKYRGIMRIFFYTTTSFVASSSYIQDGISIISDREISLLNFLGEDFIDTTNNKMQYCQMQPTPPDGSFPLASNRWYMLQYELAYDAHISDIPYSSIQLNWTLNYYNVQNISLGGTSVGELNGVIGSSSKSNIFSALMGVGKTAATGALAGIGLNTISKNTLNSTAGENKLGLPKDIFKNLSSGISNALSGATGNLAKMGANLLSAIVGGSSTSGPIPVCFTFNTQIELQGRGTEGGAFPSTPVSFWCPGTNIPPNAIGYIPLYNKSLGVLNFEGQPAVPYTYQEFPSTMEDIDGRILYLLEGYCKFPEEVDFSNYLRINPEVSKIATVTIKKQELVASYKDEYGKKNVWLQPSSFTWDIGDVPAYSNRHDFPEDLKLGVRFTVEIKPLDGGATSTIIKTFQLSFPKNL